uniref:NB-ARC domain-containing protein n=1 Tax=Arundo donax TaxID=35708 RepID=A0A0A9H6L7_ARUDO
MLMLSNFKKGSLIRVIVTTRSEQVATKISTITPYKLKPLSDDHCWTLFKHIAFQSGYTSGEDDKNVLENQAGYCKEVSRSADGSSSSWVYAARQSC